MRYTDFYFAEFYITSTLKPHYRILSTSAEQKINLSDILIKMFFATWPGDYFDLEKSWTSSFHYRSFNLQHHWDLKSSISFEITYAAIFVETQNGFSFSS